jgi:hypothetical protein
MFSTSTHAGGTRVNHQLRPKSLPHSCTPHLGHAGPSIDRMQSRMHWSKDPSPHLKYQHQERSIPLHLIFRVHSAYNHNHNATTHQSTHHPVHPPTLSIPRTTSQHPHSPRPRDAQQPHSDPVLAARHFVRDVQHARHRGRKGRCCCECDEHGYDTTCPTAYVYVCV